MGEYRDMWVFCETDDGQLRSVSNEMIAHARNMMDAYNKEYSENERVVAVVIGPRAHALGEEAIARGADVAYVADHEELEVFRLGPATRVVADAALMKNEKKSYDKPRYFLFPATNNGRDLSATIAGRLDTGLASDCNHLYIEDVEIKHKIKSGGDPKVFPRILHMKRPDFSGFEWSTILCIDNPDHDFHPQCASVIPGSFQESEPDPERRGELIEIPVRLEPRDLRVKITKRERIEKGADLSIHDAVVALGRGIGEDPTRGIKIGVDLAKALGGDLGVSRGVVTASYQVEPTVEQYIEEERQIGETGQVVAPKVYIALGVSGAIQHKKGMDKSDFIVTVNKKDEAPIREFSDVYVVGDLFDVAPRLSHAIRKRLDQEGSS